MSFHRSMQSAAFLPIFLMFIAISSRMRVLCLELQSVLQQFVSNVVNLLPTVMVKISDTAIPTATIGQMDMTASSLESSLLRISGHKEYGQHGIPSFPSHQMTEHVGSPHITVERKIPTQISRDERKGSSHPAPSKKKRRKVARNDIDDIFGNR